MAVVDKYTDPNQAAGLRANALTSLASTVSMGVALFDIAALDDDGSKYRLFRDVPVNTPVPGLMDVFTSAITNGTSYDLGVYKTQQDGGAVLKKDLFMAGQTLATAGRFDGLANVMATRANIGMTIADLYLAVVGSVIGVSECDIVLTGNTVGTVAGGGRVVALFGHD